MSWCVAMGGASANSPVWFSSTSSAAEDEDDAIFVYALSGDNRSAVSEKICHVCVIKKYTLKGCLLIIHLIIMKIGHYHFHYKK